MKYKAARTVMLIIAGSVFLFSLSMILRHRTEKTANEEYTAAITQMVVTPAPIAPKNDDTPVIPDKAPDSTAIQIPDPSSKPASEDTQETPADATEASVPIQVDFDTLMSKNPHVIGWIYCPDTPINYPIVQASDNEYYLRRLLDGSSNSYGTLFMDHRSEKDFSHWNSIIYGHSLKDTAMFGSLVNYAAQAYYDAHPEIYLLTPEGNYVIRVLAGFVATSDDEVYDALNPDETEQKRLLKLWLEDSDFVAGTGLKDDSRLITLSTCSYAFRNARYVVIGVLEDLSR